jgi:tRNA nucleotidyltransferase (CCA-adding enzyme)
MLRAARLEQRLSFRIEPNTLELLNHALPLLDRVSGERVRNELEVALAEPHPAPIFRRMADLRLLAAIHPGLEWDGWLESGFERAADFDPPKTWQLRVSPTILDLRYGSWMVRRSEAESAAVGERLRLSRPRSRLLTESSRVFHELPEWVRRGDRPSRITSMLEPVADTSLVVAWLALEGNPDAQASLDAYFSRWRKIRPGVTGETLRRMGISPGPVYRRILGEIREAWLDGEIHSEADEAARLRDLVARESSDG